MPAQNAAEPQGVGRRRAFLVVVEIGVDGATLPAPADDPLSQGLQGGGRIVTFIGAGQPVAAKIDVPRGDDPGRRRVAVVGNAQGDVMPAQQLADVRV